jgi:hypothetical protein
MVIDSNLDMPKFKMQIINDIIKYDTCIFFIFKLIKK